MSLFDSDKELQYFSKKLMISLEFECDGLKASVCASRIEQFELELYPYGFEGRVEFRGYNEVEINEIFQSDQKISVVLNYQVDEKNKKEPVKLCGIVHKKASKGIRKQSLEERAYCIYFSDSAKETWSYHYPKAIHIEKTMKDVIDAEKNPLIQIDYDWEVLNEEHPILAYDLSYSSHQKGEEQANFYSFLTWYLEQEGGILEYNYKENKYKILGKKEDQGEATTISELWVTSPLTIHPNPPRWVENEIKSYPDRLEENLIENDKGYEGVKNDWITPTNEAFFPELGGGKSKSLFFPQKGRATFWVKKFIESFQLDSILPGKLVEFKGNKLENEQWCYHPIYRGKQYRLNYLWIKGIKEAHSEVAKIDVMPFLCSCKGVAEDKEEECILRPKYTIPKYPFYAPGEVFSEVGEEEQTTFNVKKLEQVSCRAYQVKVPLAKEKDKYVISPYSPDMFPGQFYFPLLKKQQVMLSLWFKSAKIHRVLDHQPLAELSEDVQSSQIIFASNGLNEHIFMRHEYEDEKNSVFTIKQVSSSTQTQIVTLKDKEITLAVEDQDKRKLTVHFNRDQGLKLEIEEKGGELIHSTLYNEEGITHISKGDSKGSMIKQTPESIDIHAEKINARCKEFLVDAEKLATLKAASKVVIDAPITKATEEMTVG